LKTLFYRVIVLFKYLTKMCLKKHKAPVWSRKSTEWPNRNLLFLPMLTPQKETWTKFRTKYSLWRERIICHASAEGNSEDDTRIRKQKLAFASHLYLEGYSVLVRGVVLLLISTSMLYEKRILSKFPILSSSILKSICTKHVEWKIYLKALLCCILKFSLPVL
jgi:hypothetical protein